MFRVTKIFVTLTIILGLSLPNFLFSAKNNEPYFFEVSSKKYDKILTEVMQTMGLVDLRSKVFLVNKKDGCYPQVIFNQEEAVIIIDEVLMSNLSYGVIRLFIAHECAHIADLQLGFTSDGINTMVATMGNEFSRILEFLTDKYAFNMCACRICLKEIAEFFKVLAQNEQKGRVLPLAEEEHPSHYQRAVYAQKLSMHYSTCYCNYHKNNVVI